MKKVLPVGYEDIREIADKNLYFVDKSLMIKELLDRGGKVNLFTRPRRFGKTLNLSMLRRFFELELMEDGVKRDNGDIFENLAISSCGERYMAHLGQYPVINLSLKSAKQPTFALAYSMLKRQIAREYGRHRYILGKAVLSGTEETHFEAIMEETDNEALYIDSLEFLSYCLRKFHHKKVIVLIDEYDVPLENAYFEGFYEEMTAFIRSLFESVLKTNPFLEFAVITGCLRISKESIFTGLNNLDVYSVLNPDFADCFGFTEAEVKEILDYYNLGQKYDEIKEWYDGYRFGGKEIYNPWSIINYTKTAEKQPDLLPKAYWSNTSSNSIIKEMVEEADFETRDEIEALLAGDAVEKIVHEDITYGDIHESRDNLWNFLFFTGYLKMTGERQVDDMVLFKLAIPNRELRSVYRNTILTWFDQKIKGTDMSPLFEAMERGDCERFGSFVSEQLLGTISFYDYAENYYHGFLAGLLRTSKKYRVYSNRESGSGRPDLILKTQSVRNGKAVILELKAAEHAGSMEACCQAALEQIESRNYEASLRAEGYQDIMKYGICFYKKDCLVRRADEREKV